MVNKARAGGGRNDRRAPTGGRPQRPPRGDGDRPRAPRKCANCGKEHEQRACPHPSVSVADRPCWTCGKKGHPSAQCPSKADRSPIKAIEDALPFFGNHIKAVYDNDGFRPPKKTWRPVQRGASLLDFIPTETRNRFGIIEEPEAVATTVGSQPAGSQPDIDISIRAKPAIPSPTMSRKQELKSKKTVKTTKLKATTGYVAALDSTLMSCRAKSSGGSQISDLEAAVMKAVKEFNNTVCMVGVVSTDAVKHVERMRKPSTW